MIIPAIMRLTGVDVVNLRVMQKLSILFDSYDPVKEITIV